ncbi:50S ribosomal protein L11 methyltransferase [Marinibactrum halimedae]|uniref:Methyltransferase n=1 Tax=Marinibactrum halimedae TaxID=1444977 RepID=A0AA37WNT6_9GAMM|nr:50S ribosomal protein L11 methyltransferase [Marinibactrum halimedae]MCD9460542.1 50S ribosomal protein L11 methyltransferase [Marinibactrum halimedae]GLS27905.1 methyltransferase [Marinibactrum halimedae]
MSSRVLSVPNALLNHLQTTVPNAQLIATPLPLTPDIQLWLVDPSLFQTRLPESVVAAVFDEPAYWSFCWASGQVLAAQILANPHWVKGKTVVDFGCGSAVVAIAAAMAGAANAIACDLDHGACLSAAANAELNNVDIIVAQNINHIQWPNNQPKADVLFAADVLYDPDNFPLLDAFSQWGEAICIADSRVKNFNHQRYARIAEHRATSHPDMGELEEYSFVKLYANDNFSNNHL